MRDSHYQQKLEAAFACVFGEVPPITDEEVQRHDAAANQATAQSEWRLHNPPQKDLFSRG